MAANSTVQPAVVSRCEGLLLLLCVHIPTPLAWHNQRTRNCGRHSRTNSTHTFWCSPSSSFSSCSFWMAASTSVCRYVHGISHVHDRSRRHQRVRATISWHTPAAAAAALVTAPTAKQRPASTQLLLLLLLPTHLLGLAILQAGLQGAHNVALLGDSSLTLFNGCLKLLLRCCCHCGGHLVTTACGGY